MYVVFFDLYGADGATPWFYGLWADAHEAYTAVERMNLRAPDDMFYAMCTIAQAISYGVNNLPSYLVQG